MKFNTVKCAVWFLAFTFVVTTLTYDVLYPIFLYNYNTTTNEQDALDNHRKIIINQFTKDLGDFLSCLTIMYMLHSFGPYS